MSSIVRLLAEALRRLAAISSRTVRTEAAHAREAMKYLGELEDILLAEERLDTPARRWSHEDLVAGVDLVRPGARHPAEAGRRRYES